MRWEWIHLDEPVPYLRVPAEISKTGQERTDEMPENLMGWLRAHRMDEGTFLPRNKRKTKSKYGEGFKEIPRLFDEARRKAGLMENWDNNAIRDSFCSYNVELHRDRFAPSILYEPAFEINRLLGRWRQVYPGCVLQHPPDLLQVLPRSPA